MKTIHGTQEIQELVGTMSFEIRSFRPQNMKKKKKKKNWKKEFGENKISQLLQTGKVWMDLSHILRKINDAKAILFL